MLNLIRIPSLPRARGARVRSERADHRLCHAAAGTLLNPQAR